MADNIPNLPAFDLWDGYATTLDVYDPCWLYAGRLTDLDTGESQRFTYLAAGVRTQSKWYQQMLDYVGGALPIGESRIIIDPEMMHGQAKYTLHELRPLDVTA